MRDVGDVAEELEISERRVRQLLAHGQLSGHRLGRKWIIPQAELDAFQERGRPLGRPWSTGAAWTVLSLVAPLHTQSTAVQVSRARQRLRDHPLTDLLPQLSHRAKRLCFVGHPTAVARLAQDDAVVLSGVSAAQTAGADLVSVAPELEAYVRDVDLLSTSEEYGLVPQSQRPNVWLRVIPSPVWPFAPGARHAPDLIVALDLLESSDSRSRRAGLALLESL